MVSFSFFVDSPVFSAGMRSRCHRCRMISFYLFEAFAIQFWRDQTSFEESRRDRGGRWTLMTHPLLNAMFQWKRHPHFRALLSTLHEHCTVPSSGVTKHAKKREREREERGERGERRNERGEETKNEELPLTRVCRIARIMGPLVECRLFKWRCWVTPLSRAQFCRGCGGLARAAMRAASKSTLSDCPATLAVALCFFGAEGVRCLRGGERSRNC